MHHIITTSPKNIAALAMLPFAGIFEGTSIKKNVSVLKTQAQPGSPVFPETTSTNRVTAKTSRPI
jgi:hypothetical protein